MMTDVEDQIGVMLDQRRAGAGTRDRDHQRARAARSPRPNPGRRLVAEAEERRAQHQRARDFRKTQFAVLQPVGAHRRETLKADRRQGQHGGVAQQNFVAAMARQRQKSNSMNVPWPSMVPPIMTFCSTDAEPTMRGVWNIRAMRM